MLYFINLNVIKDMNEYITINPNVLVGKPVIKGTRIPVTLILNLFAHGYTIKRILEAYPVLTKEAVKAALEYAEDRLGREEFHFTEANFAGTK